MYSHILLCGAHGPVLAAASRWAAAGVEYQDRSLKKARLHSQSSDTASSFLPFRNCAKKNQTNLHSTLWRLQLLNYLLDFPLICSCDLCQDCWRLKLLSSCQLVTCQIFSICRKVTLWNKPWHLTTVCQEIELPGRLFKSCKTDSVSEIMIFVQLPFAAQESYTCIK